MASRKDVLCHGGEDLFRRFFDLSSDILCIAGFDGFFKKVNSAMVKTLGWSEEELLSRPWIEFVHPDDRPLTDAARQIQREGEQVFNFKNRYQCKDGSYHWLSWNSLPVPEQSLIFAVAREITWQIQAEEDLRRRSTDLEKQVHERAAVLAGINRIFREALFCETEEQLGKVCLAVAENLTGSKFGFIGELEQTGKFSTIAISNPGWSACEMPPSEAMHFINDMEVRGLRRDVLTHGEARIFNEPVSHPDWIKPPKGHPTITSFLGVPLKLAGKIFGMIGLANREGGYLQLNQEDMEVLAVAMVEALTRKRAEWQRKQAETALRESEQRFKDITENAVEWIWETDFEGKYTYSSPVVEKLLGYTPGEVLGKHFYDFFLPEERQELKCAALALLADKHPFQDFINSNLHKNGETIWLSSSGVPMLDASGTLLGYRGANHDISARKRAEEELQQSLSRLRRVMGEIVQTMALTVEVRDPYTAGHQRRVTLLAQAIAREMGLSGQQLDAVWVAGTLHDLGKIYVPEGILNRPGRLSEIEFAMIKTHCQKGYEILRPIQFPWPVALIVRQHHERLDGSGYPDGLQDGEILLESRILAVADVVEAMASHRPYRPALGIEEALKEISEKRGIWFDPVVVDACFRVFREKNFKFEQK